MRLKAKKVYVIPQWDAYMGRPVEVLINSPKYCNCCVWVDREFARSIRGLHSGSINWVTEWDLEVHIGGHDYVFNAVQIANGDVIIDIINAKEKEED